MSVAWKLPMSLEAFLDWESRQETKYEFDGCQPVAMAGASAEHAAIQGNLMFAIGARLLGGPCRMYGSDLKILAAGAIRYPDAFVVCTPVPRGTLVVTDPVIVFEVLSPGTSSVDLLEKNRQYRATQSIQRYVILEQGRQSATFYRRAGDLWIADFVSGEGELALPEIGVTVSLAELYHDVQFPPEVLPRESVR
jgi:Uma2 family endonuclease